MSDAAVAALCRELGVDIAVDLKGYTQDGRPGILAHRAAPVQVSWLGYPGTLGALCRLRSDRRRGGLPPGAESDWSEAVVRLPLYQPNDAWAGPTAAQPRRGRPAGRRLRLLLPEQSRPRSRRRPSRPGWRSWPRARRVLWLYEGAPGAAANLRARRRAGITPDRLVFAKPVPHAEHLARQALADLVLDTWPYGAHTTASDALRMGVPS
jgi:protein O-GlcNAc transferase